MGYLLLSLLCSLLVGFFLKKINFTNHSGFSLVLLTSYIIASLSSYLFFKPSINSIINVSDQYLLIFILGILMPSVFFILNKSLKINGIAKTDIFQRLSLIIPVLLSFWLFNENFTLIKLLVIVLSFMAILLLLYKNSTNNGKNSIVLGFLVFIGYGVIDTLFKIIAINNSLYYTTILFLVFSLCSFTSTLFIIKNKEKPYRLSNIWQGIVLGCLNFANIFFYLKAHQYFKESPTLVFITMNLGVILGGFLIGKFYFNEKFSKQTYLGCCCAAFAIVILALHQMKYL